MNRLEGKRVLITGASRGLGRALALEFAREGAESLALVARDRVSLERVAAEIAATSPGTRVTAIAADLSRDDQLERAVATLLSEAGGRLHVLVNNASTLGPAPMPFLLDYPSREFRSVVDTNLIAPFLLIQKLLPALIDGGSIINVTSDAGVVGYPGWGAYGISKFGIEGLSQTWAGELEGTAVRLNWVDPGNMNTEMHRAAEPEEDPSQWADPGNVTSVFVYLASDESAGVHGQRFRAQEWIAESAQKGAA